MGKWLIRIIEAFLVLISFIFIYSNENFQKKICPKIYWENKVKELSTTVMVNESRIRHLELLLEREEHLASFDLKFAPLHSGSTVEDVHENYLKKTCGLQDDISSARRKLKCLKCCLQQAASHLSQVRR